MYFEDYDQTDSSQRGGDDIFSIPVRAGKRTYFFDVKATKNNDYYLTITESKRRVDKAGRFLYDKHKIFLYKEDFDKFAAGLEESIKHIRENYLTQESDNREEGEEDKNPYTDLNFEDI